MAEGFLCRLAGDDFKGFSAGVMPIKINFLAITVMAEVDINIASQRSKSIKEFLGQQFDYVATVCDNAKEACPVFPGRYKRMHWYLEDPVEANGNNEEKIIVFRKIRDQIKNYIELFLKESKT
ncbi:MAG: arsenate reductase ArsC [Candidatus Omnitrophica bacterium]|nr:arsenate reductase ArsC [Candidatus Omnitrophota bacterium]